MTWRIRPGAPERESGAYQGLIRAPPECGRGASLGTVRCMMRKIFWLLTVVASTSVVLNFMDRRRAKRRRQLWAEATDPL